MTGEPRSIQDILAQQFQLTAEISRATGEYHRLLQKVAAAGFARQMAEDGPEADLEQATAAETAAKHTAQTCETQIEALEQQLAALGREMSALK